MHFVSTIASHVNTHPTSIGPTYRLCVKSAATDVGTTTGRRRAMMSAQRLYPISCDGGKLHFWENIPLAFSLCGGFPGPH